MSLADIITAAWEDGNCVGLDGWIGESRGSVPDDYAIRRRDEFVAILAASIKKAGLVVIPIPTVAFKGPHDTDASALYGAADRIEGGYPAGGSNVRAAVAGLLRDVAWEVTQ